MASTDRNTTDWFGFACLSDDFIPPPPPAVNEETEAKKRESEKDISVAHKAEQELENSTTSEEYGKTHLLSDNSHAHGAVELISPKDISKSVQEESIHGSEYSLNEPIVSQIPKGSPAQITPPPSPTNVPKVNSEKRGNASSLVLRSPSKIVSSKASPISKCSVVLQKNPLLDNLPRQNSSENVFALVNDKIEIKNNPSSENTPEKERKLNNNESESLSSPSDVKRQNSFEKKTDSMVFNADIEVRKSGRLKSSKCSSRYRGDYGIRAEVYTKLTCKKLNESDTDTESCETLVDKGVSTEIEPKGEVKYPKLKVESQLEKHKEVTTKGETVTNIDVQKSTDKDFSNNPQKQVEPIAKVNQLADKDSQHTDLVPHSSCEQPKTDFNDGSNECCKHLSEANTSVIKLNEEVSQKNSQTKSKLSPGNKNVTEKLANANTDIQEGFQGNTNTSLDNTLTTQKPNKERNKIKREPSNVEKKKFMKKELKNSKSSQIMKKPIKKRVGPVLRTHITLLNDSQKDSRFDSKIFSEEPADTKYDNSNIECNEKVADNKSEKIELLTDDSSFVKTKEKVVDRLKTVQQTSAVNSEKLDERIANEIHESITSVENTALSENNLKTNICDKNPKVPYVKKQINEVHQSQTSTSLSSEQNIQNCDVSRVDSEQSVKVDESAQKNDTETKSLPCPEVQDYSDRKSKTSSYVHSISRLVSKQKDRKKPQSHPEHEVCENIPLEDATDFSVEEDSSFSVLESLRLRLFANAGIKPLEVVDKPKVFESKIKQPKVKISNDAKNSSQDSQSLFNYENSVKASRKSAADSHPTKSNILSSRSSNLSDDSSRCSTPNSEILEEVSKNLELLQKSNQKHASSKMGKPKKSKFEQKKFMLRSMSRKVTESDSESHSSVSTEHSDLSLNDSLAKKKRTKNVSDSGMKVIKKRITVPKKDIKPVKKVKERQTSDSKTVKKQDSKPICKPKPVKCHSCGHIFKNKELLKKHYPCRMRQTRTWSQNKLRPNRVFKRVEAPPKEKGRKRFICLLPKSKKDGDKSRPSLLTSRKTKFRRVKGKRRRKLHMILQDLMGKRKPKTYPHLVMNYENMTPKSQFLYKLGLFSPTTPCSIRRKEPFNPSANSFVQNYYEQNKENRSSSFSTGYKYEQQHSDEKLLNLPLENETSLRILHKDKISLSLHTEPSGKDHHSPPILDKVDEENDSMLLVHTSPEKEIVVNNGGNGPPILELQFESPKKTQKERHFLDFVAVKDDFDTDINSVISTDMNRKGNDLQSSPTKAMAQRHYTDIIDVTEVKNPEKEHNTERTVLNDSILWEQSERGEMTLAEIREILKPKSRKENEFSKESLLKLRCDLAKLLNKVKSPAKDSSSSAVVMGPKPSVSGLESAHPEFDFSMYERKGLFETLETADSNSFTRQTSLEETGHSCTDSEISVNDSDHSDILKSSLDYEQNLLSPIDVESDSIESTTKGGITDNILQMLSTLEDKGSVADNMTNLLQILAENLGIIDSSPEQEPLIASEEENILPVQVELSENLGIQQTNKTEDINVKLQKADLDGSISSENILQSNVEVYSFVKSDKELHADNLIQSDELQTEMSVPGIEPQSEIYFDTEKESVDGQTAVFSDVVLNEKDKKSLLSSRPSTPEIVEQAGKPIEAKYLKESALFKSITELNSIETDSDSNLGESYDAYTMSQRLAELKATNCDGVASDVNSDALSDYKENVSDSEASEKSKDIDTEKSSIVYSSTDHQHEMMLERPMINASPTEYHSDDLSTEDEPETLQERPRLIMKIKVPTGTFNTSDNIIHKESLSCTSPSAKSSDISDYEESKRNEESAAVIDEHNQEVAHSPTDYLEDRKMPLETALKEVMEEMVQETNSDTNVTVKSPPESCFTHAIESNTETEYEGIEITSYPRKLKLKTVLTIGDSFDYESDTSSSCEKIVTTVPQVGSSPRAQASCYDDLNPDTFHNVTKEEQSEDNCTGEYSKDNEKMTTGHLDKNSNVGSMKSAIENNISINENLDKDISSGKEDLVLCDENEDKEVYFTKKSLEKADEIDLSSTNDAIGESNEPDEVNQLNSDTNVTSECASFAEPNIFIRDSDTEFVEMKAVNTAIVENDNTEHIVKSDYVNDADGTAYDSIVKPTVDFDLHSQASECHSFILEPEMIEPVEIMRNSPKNNILPSSEMFTNRANLREIIEQEIIDNKSDSSTSETNKVSDIDELSSPMQINESGLDNTETVSEEPIDDQLLYAIKKDSQTKVDTSEYDTSESSEVQTTEYNVLETGSNFDHKLTNENKIEEIAVGLPVNGEPTDNEIENRQIIKDIIEKHSVVKGDEDKCSAMTSQNQTLTDVQTDEEPHENNVSLQSMDVINLSQPTILCETDNTDNSQSKSLDGIKSSADENVNGKDYLDSVLPTGSCQDGDGIHIEKLSESFPPGTNKDPSEKQINKSETMLIEKDIHKGAKEDQSQHSMMNQSSSDSYIVPGKNIIEESIHTCQKEVENKKNESEISPILKTGTTGSKNDTERKRKRISVSDYLSRAKKRNVTKDSSLIHTDSITKVPNTNDSHLSVSQEPSRVIVSENLRASDWNETKQSSEGIEIYKTQIETDTEIDKTENQGENIKTTNQTSKRYVSMPLIKKSDIFTIENKALYGKTKDLDSIVEDENDMSANTDSEIAEDVTPDVAKPEDDVLSVFDSIFSLGETVLSISKSENNSGVADCDKVDDGNLFSALDTLCKVGEDVINLRKSTSEENFNEPLIDDTWTKVNEGKKQVTSNEIDVEVIDLTETALDDSFPEDKVHRNFFLELDDWVKESQETELLLRIENENGIKETNVLNIYTAPGSYISELSSFSGVHLSRFRYNLFSFEEEYFDLSMKEDEAVVENTGIDESGQESDIVQTEPVICDNTVLKPPPDRLSNEPENSVDSSECYNDDFDDMLAAQMAINEEAKNSEVKVSLESDTNQFVDNKLNFDKRFIKEAEHSLVSMEYDTISEDCISDDESGYKKGYKRRHREVSSEKSEHGKRKKHSEKYSKSFEREKPKYGKHEKESKRPDKEHRNIENRETSRNSSSRSHSYERKSVDNNNKTDRNKLFLKEKRSLNSR